MHCSQTIANVDLKKDAPGVLFAHGSRFGGHTLFIKDRKLYYVYNFLGIEEQVLVAKQALTPGKHTLGMEFARDKEGENGISLGKAILYVDDKAVAEGPLRVQSG
jgi:arylsulfatase